jgi:threonine dehydratase
LAALAADALGAQRIGSIAWDLSCSATSPPATCWPTRPSARRSNGCGATCAWPSSRLRRWAWRRCGAAPVRPAASERVAVVLCGANFDPASLA